MTTTPNDDAQTREDREWQAQEAARLAQRSARSPQDRPAAAAYQKIAAFLAEPDVPPPPSNLAHALAKRVEAIAQVRKREDQVFLQRVRLAFVLGYGSCMLLACLLYRDALIAWAGSPATTLLSGAAGWIPVLATCAGVTWVMARKRTSRS